MEVNLMKGTEEPRPEFQGDLGHLPEVSQSLADQSPDRQAGPYRSSEHFRSTRGPKYRVLPLPDYE